MGVVKKSLQTWQRREDSRGARAESGVGSQSVLSVTVVVSMMRRMERRRFAGMRWEVGSWWE
jgi:hypothetical protein